jgi:hypothetical protein
MKLTRVGGLVAVSALLATGCKHDAGPFYASTPPLAFTRFVNAVPDTFATDWHFIDQIEYSPSAITMAYRGFTPYQQTAPGPRHLRIFTDPGVCGGQSGTCPIGLVTTILIDSTITFEANHHYTLIHTGFTRSGATPHAQLLVLDDDIPSNIGTSVDMRVVNLAAGIGAVDVYTTKPPAAFAGAPQTASLAYLAATGYSALTADTLSLHAQVAGSALTQTASATAATTAAPAGIPANTDPAVNTQAVGGSKQGGSAFTAFVFPPSVTGSPAAVFATAGIVYIIDHHPR